MCWRAATRPAAGESIVQPGLIDNNCTPYGQPGAAITPVGVLTAWLPLSSSTTNVDAAIAQVNSGAVNTSGEIQELGLPQANGTLAAAPPGISSTGGKGESWISRHDRGQERPHYRAHLRQHLDGQPRRGGLVLQGLRW